MSLIWAEEVERLFVACALPREVIRALNRWQLEELEGRDDLRATGSLHLTLAFIGDVRKDRVPRVVEALATVSFAPFDLELGETLFLPRRGAKKVVALSVSDPGGGLQRLQADVSEVLAESDLFKPGKRPWLPHVTVARYRRGGEPFSLQNVNIPQFGVVRMVLYSSLLDGAGAVHTPVETFPAS
jgi:RNA 2',3'-cyclic 3'-phosphodiesterase